MFSEKRAAELQALGHVIYIRQSRRPAYHMTGMRRRAAKRATACKRHLGVTERAGCRFVTCLSKQAICPKIKEMQAFVSDEAPGTSQEQGLSEQLHEVDSVLIPLH